MFTEFKKYNTFAPTVHTTLPIRTASQGVSFAFIQSVITNFHPAEN